MKDQKICRPLLAVFILLVCTYLVLSFFLLKESMLLSRRVFTYEILITALLLIGVYVGIIKQKKSKR
ncbi:hypothetical protein [Dyadobacter sp. Leaf189]|uniref:hypothetical protein n=1 Tax=Dyadobacter sp. Leaf189 TaxID=1736295 RepID=UPI0006F2F6E0|nr:hypothetical protein [Dyadobacter sp. Leaf189]KQS31073.1 hypothetical protein ASG33_12000 [Dyadobacter sp. Leaf189]